MAASLGMPRSARIASCWSGRTEFGQLPTPSAHALIIMFCATRPASKRSRSFNSTMATAVAQLSRLRGAMIEPASFLRCSRSRRTTKRQGWVFLLPPLARPACRLLFKATLSSYGEVPTNSTTGQGDLDLRIDDSAKTITFTLTYSGLAAPAAAAHIHLGARSTSGGVSVFLCGGGGQALCSPGTSSEATATGTITAANVIGPTTQGIAPAEFDELVF